MFEKYEGLIDLNLVLKEVYNYDYDPNNLQDFYLQKFVEMECNGVTATCWIKYNGEKYLFKPMEDANINWWGELLSYQLAKKLGIPCCKYRACKLGDEYGVITEIANKNNQTLILGCEIFQRYLNQYPVKNGKISALENEEFLKLFSIPKEFLDFNHYDQQRHLFNYLNNLEHIGLILSGFKNYPLISNNQKHYLMSEESINRNIDFLTLTVLFDIITLQVDRHVNNWGILFDEKDFNPFPIFDNASSFGLGTLNIKAKIDDFRNIVMNYKYSKNDSIIQDYMYKVGPNLTLSKDNVIDPIHKIKDSFLVVFDDVLSKLDSKYISTIYSILSCIQPDELSKLIDQAEKENGVIMDSNVRFYIETIMEFHSIYLNDIITKHKVRSSTYGNQNNITKF